MFIHSNERLESLLSYLNMNKRDYTYNSVDRPDSLVGVERHDDDHDVGDDANMEPNFDILTVDRHDNEENDSTGSNDTRDGEMQNDLVGARENFSKSSDKADSQKSWAHEDNNRNFLEYNELENDYEYYKNMILNDSLEESQTEQGEAHEKLSLIPKDNDFERNDLNDEGEFPKRKESHLVPKFRYKEPNPRFLEKNKLDISKAKKTSYRQKYLDERNGNKKKTKNVDSNRNKGTTTKDDRNFGFEMQSDRNQIPLDGTSMGAHVDGSGGKDQLKHLRENIEISRLDEMIREEENNLKNDVLNLPLSQPYAQLNYPEVTDFGYNHNNNYNGYTQQDINLGANTAFQNFPEYPLSSISKPPEPNKRASYAGIHSVLQNRNPVDGDETSSYAAQHLEKKSPHNYKTYSLKEYRVINKDIKLQKSLGPDLASEDYLAKVSKQAFSFAKAGQGLRLIFN